MYKILIVVGESILFCFSFAEFSPKDDSVSSESETNHSDESESSDDQTIDKLVGTSEAQRNIQIEQYIYTFIVLHCCMNYPFIICIPTVIHSL